MVAADFGGLLAQVSRLGLRVGGHPAISLHSSNEPGELSQWLWSWWQHHKHWHSIIIIIIICNVTIRQSAHDFLFVFNRNNASILHRSQDTASYESKFVDITLSHLHLAPPLKVNPFEFRKDFWHQKTRVPGLSCDIVCVVLSVVILIQYRLVTDRQTRQQLIPC